MRQDPDEGPTYELGLHHPGIDYMKIAYFSPFNPQKSGISDYSESLLPYLEKMVDIDLWVDGFIPSSPSLSRYRIIDYSRNRSARSQLKNYDLLVYNIGNNPFFHAGVFDMFLNYPGIVILHDYVLFYLVTGYYLDLKKDERGYIQEFYFNYGPKGIDAVKTLLRSYTSLLEYPHPEQYPLIGRIIKKAPGIIVHSDTAREFILKQEYPEEKVVRINQINYMSGEHRKTLEEKRAAREKYGIGEDDILVASFGFIAPTKRNQQVIEVINRIVQEQNIPIRYLMVGEGNYTDAFLSDRIKKTGYTGIDEYETLQATTDIVINLRHPSMGETSATLLRAMAAGKPCIVSDSAWFSELPGDAVMKISCDPGQENLELAKAIKILVSDFDMRCGLGRKAQEYAQVYHNPKNIVQEMKDFFTLIQNTI